MLTNKSVFLTNLNSFEFIGLSVSYWFFSLPAEHVQRSGKQKKKVPLSHSVIHRKQACCTSNHTSAAAQSVECFYSRVGSQQLAGQFHLSSTVRTQTLTDRHRRDTFLALRL